MATYFVKTGGSDAATGLTDALAWATIAKVSGKVFVAGDIVQFRQGDTFTGQMYSANIGSVTFRSYDPATSLPGSGRAILQYSDTVFGCPTNVHNVVIDNLELKTSLTSVNALLAPCISNDAAGNNDNWIVKNCLIHACPGNGIRVNNSNSTGWQIFSNSIYDTGDSGILLNTSGGGHVIYSNTIYTTGTNSANIAAAKHGIYAHAPDYVIRNNDFYDNQTGQSISMRNVGVSGSAGQAYSNTIHDTPYGIGFFSNADTGTGTLRVFSNRLYNISGYGIYVGDGTTTYFDTVIASNTIVGTAAMTVGIDVGDILHANATVKNNIVSGGIAAFFGKNASIDVAKTTTENFNDFYNQSSATPFKWTGTSYSFANYKSASSMGASSITTDPVVSTAPALTPSAAAVLNTGTTTVTSVTYATTGSPDVLYYGSAPNMGGVQTGGATVTGSSALSLVIRFGSAGSGGSTGLVLTPDNPTSLTLTPR